MSTNFSQWPVLCIHFFEGCRQCIFLFQSLLCYPRKIRIRGCFSTFDKITVHMPLDMCENVAHRTAFLYPTVRDSTLFKPLLNLRCICFSRNIRQLPPSNPLLALFCSASLPACIIKSTVFSSILRPAFFFFTGYAGCVPAAQAQHKLCSGHSVHRGVPFGMQTTAPSSIRLWVKIPHLSTG